MDPLFACLIFAWWLVSRGAPGVIYAARGQTPPWVQQKAARLALRSGAAAAADYTRRRAAMNFFQALWDDCWDDLHEWRQEHRARRMNGEYLTPELDVEATSGRTDRMRSLVGRLLARTGWGRRRAATTAPTQSEAPVTAHEDEPLPADGSPSPAPASPTEPTLADRVQQDIDNAVRVLQAEQSAAKCRQCDKPLPASAPSEWFCCPRCQDRRRAAPQPAPSAESTDTAEDESGEPEQAPAVSEEPTAEPNPPQPPRPHLSVVRIDEQPPADTTSAPQEGETTVTAAAEPQLNETAKIGATRDYFLELDQHVAGDLVVSLDKALNMLDRVKLRDGVITELMRVRELFVQAGEGAQAAYKLLNDGHSQMEQAVNDTPNHADMEFYERV